MFSVEMEGLLINWDSSQTREESSDPMEAVEVESSPLIAAKSVEYSEDLAH